MQKKVLQAINFIIFWETLMFYQILLSPQVKGCTFITDKNGIYELTHELPNKQTFRVLGN